MKPRDKASPRLTSDELATLKSQHQQLSKRGTLEDRARAKAVLSVIRETERHRIEEARRAVIVNGARHFASQLPNL